METRIYIPIEDEKQYNALRDILRGKGYEMCIHEDYNAAVILDYIVREGQIAIAIDEKYKRVSWCYPEWYHNEGYTLMPFNLYMGMPTMYSFEDSILW